MTPRPVAVIGLGLIGASLAGALRSQGHFVRGLDRDPAARHIALERGLVDDVADDLPRALDGATLVILAVPVLSILSLVRDVDALASPDAVIMDVGSVKAPVLHEMAALPGAPRAIGGHPIAGKEQAGPAAADASLFRNRSFVLVPSTATSAETLQAAEDLVRSIGAVPVVLTATEHDRMVARTSHLPQLLATALALSLEPHDEIVAGPGLRDMTRLAASGSSMWNDIFISNADNIAAALATCIAQLQTLARMASGGDETALEQSMRRANERSALIVETMTS